MPPHIISPEPIKSTCGPLDLQYIIAMQKVAEKSLNNEKYASDNSNCEKNPEWEAHEELLRIVNSSRSDQMVDEPIQRTHVVPSNSFYWKPPYVQSRWAERRRRSQSLDERPMLSAF
ncbi:hypothetical protein VKS41_004385 [Umbelopsis sp. WA50703]